MTTEPVRVEMDLLQQLENSYGKKIFNEYGLMPTKPQLIEIAINLALGKEIKIIKKKKCLNVINY